MEILDGTTIHNFINDDEPFTVVIQRRFAELDTDKDGFLNYDEMLIELQSLRVMEPGDTGIVWKNTPAKDDMVYDLLFVHFDHDYDWAVSLAVYTAQTKKMMMAIGDGLGFLPVQMILEDNSLLKRALHCLMN